MKTIYFILLIAVVAVLFIVVGFLGNKIVDGMQPQKARYCGECGQPLKEGAAFCTNCGHPTNG